MAICKICLNDSIVKWLDFGPQVLTNRFVTDPNEVEYTHPCKVGVCQSCATIQLESPVPVEEMRPRFDWIFYNEPEAHLDDVVQLLTELPGIGKQSKIHGVSYKDDSTLERLNRLGYENTWRADSNGDLGISAANAGIESIQQSLNQPTVERIVEKVGSADVLLVRHVLEHSYDIQTVLSSCRKLIHENGYILFEMPDARRAFDKLDYSTIWEEHLFYFTPTTLKRFFNINGFDVPILESYHFTLENSLIAVIQPSRWQRSYPFSHTYQGSEEDLSRASKFIDMFSTIKEQMQNHLHSYYAQGKKVALLGAGHLSAAYLNIYELSKYISCVVDDNPKKQGLMMPGSKKPILSSMALIEQEIDLCLMSVRPEVEDVIMTKNAEFIRRGGRICSVFPDSQYSMMHLANNTKVQNAH